jgi:hypothetical protein
MSFTLCSSGAIVIKAGKNVNSDAASSGAILEQFSDEAEGRICAETRYDWVSNYASIGSNFKPILTDVSSSLAAIKLVMYDMSGYTNRGEAEDVLNINFDLVQKALKVLADDKVKTKMGATNA